MSINGLYAIEQNQIDFEATDPSRAGIYNDLARHGFGFLDMAVQSLKILNDNAQRVLLTTGLSQAVSAI